MGGEASRINGRKGGKPKGYRHAHTIEKAEARALVRQMVIESLGPLVRSQIAHAIGIGHVFTRDKAGKFTRIEDQDEIDRLLAEGVEGEHYHLFSKDPSVAAFTDLLNRAIDKPSEHVEVTGKDQGPLEIVIRAPWRKE